MSHSNGNIYTIDEERRLAYRGELKRRLAELSVKTQRIAELQNIVQKLNADSDRAAEQHGVEAGRLQTELDSLDAEQIDAVLSGTKTPAKSIARRTEILAELSKLNQILEVACEANRRAARPIQKQIGTLRAEIAAGASLDNELASLCSPATRRARLLNGHRLKWVDIALKDAQRMVTVLEANVKIAKLNRDGSSESIKGVRLADWRSVVAELQSDIAALHQADAVIQSQALAE